MVTKNLPLESHPGNLLISQRDQVFDAFRRWGYLQANLDPLGQYLLPAPVPELNFDGEAAEEAKGYYCGSIGVEFMHLPDAARREWIQERMEQATPAPDQRQILERLIQADLFEQVIQSRYLGTKRFSLEGVTVLIPFLDEILNHAADHGAIKSVLSMSHRGRLNVMANTFGKSATDIFSKFEDANPRSILGGGDVKYHVGATGEFLARGGGKIGLHLVSNPSHLEAVDPVAMGRARAQQVRLGENGQDQVLPVLIHGDAAFAGQGIWAETLSLGDMCGFTVGGTIQIIVNNLIGFTADPEECYPSRFSSDIGKRLPIPIFHVNAEDPEAAVRVASLAIDYRYTFRTDVIIDLIGYRRHGHSEVDDPTITQPLRYAKIKDHSALYEIYAKRIGVDPSARVKEIHEEFAEAQKQAKSVQKKPVLVQLPEYWAPYFGGRHKAEMEVDTGLPRAQVQAIAEKLTAYPGEFHIHAKIKKLLEQRAAMGRGQQPFDYGMAEAVAFGALLAR